MLVVLTNQKVPAEDLDVPLSEEVQAASSTKR